MVTIFPRPPPSAYNERYRFQNNWVHHWFWGTLSGANTWEWVSKMDSAQHLFGGTRIHGLGEGHTPGAHCAAATNFGMTVQKTCYPPSFAPSDGHAQRGIQLRNSILAVRASIQNGAAIQYTCIGAPDCPRFPQIMGLFRRYFGWGRIIAVEGIGGNTSSLPPVCGALGANPFLPPPRVQYNQMGL